MRDEHLSDMEETLIVYHLSFEKERKEYDITCILSGHVFIHDFNERYSKQLATCLSVSANLIYVPFIQLIIHITIVNYNRYALRRKRFRNNSHVNRQIDPHCLEYFQY